MKIFAALALVAVSLIPNRARAELVTGVTVFRDLVSFDSASPGTIISSTTLTGIEDQFESIAGIDFRPATGQLYALGNAPGSIYRIYSVNPSTAVATKIGADITTITGTFMGFDFNPNADRIRIVTDADQNYRFHPDTGGLVLADSALAYAAGDANVGANPNIVGVAYSNNVANAATTTLFDIDSNLDILTVQNPPNNGTLTTLGPLGFDFSNTVGFDISGVTGTAFATSGDQSTFVTRLFSVNLSSGAATFVGDIGNALLINDIAAPVSSVPEPTCMGLTSLVALLIATRKRHRGCVASS